jgi:hypothetical protein
LVFIASMANHWPWELAIAALVLVSAVLLTIVITGNY